MKKKILYLSDVEYFKGGAERSLFDAMATPTIDPVLGVPAPGPLSDLAKEKSIPVEVIDFGAVLTVRRPFKIADIFRTFGDAFRAAQALKSAAKKHGCAGIHSNGLKAHGVACLARLLGGPPVIVHYRSIPHTAPERLFWRATQLISRHVVLVSRPCWHGAQKPANVHVIFNGIKPLDPAILPTRPKDRRPFMLGFAGRIHPSKGVHDLIEWVEVAKGKGLDIRLSIRGEAAPDEPEYDTHVRKMVTDKNLSDVIVFEGRCEGFENIYGNVDAVVVSSVTPDPLPRAVMESSALGLPVLGYPAGGIPDMLVHEENGYLITNGADLHKYVARLMEDTSEYERISKAAKKNALENFSMEVLHANLSKLYETL